MKSVSPWAILLIILAFFLLPLLLACFMYTGVIDFEAESTRNYVLLVQPQLPVSCTVLPLHNRT